MFATRSGLALLWLMLNCLYFRKQKIIKIGKYYKARADKIAEGAGGI